MLNGPLLDHLTNMYGPVKADIKKRLARFLHHPSFKTWDDIHGIVISTKGGVAGTTVWQAVIQLDPKYRDIGRPHGSKAPASEKWFTFPHPLLVARALKMLGGDRPLMMPEGRKVKVETPAGWEVPPRPPMIPDPFKTALIPFKKSMTYGNMPGEVAWEEHWKHYVPNGLYHYDLKGSAARIAKIIGVPVTARVGSDTMYDMVRDLIDYGVLEALELAADILSTLGFEWI